MLPVWDQLKRGVASGLKRESSKNLGANFRVTAPRCVWENTEEEVNSDCLTAMNRVVFNSWNNLPGMFFVVVNFFLKLVVFLACLRYSQGYFLKQLNFQTLFCICQSYLIISPIQSKPLENSQHLICFQLWFIFSAKKKCYWGLLYIANFDSCDARILLMGEKKISIINSKIKLFFPFL